MKFPWMQFFAGDWLKDPAVSRCSPATRGIWIDLLCAMHESDRSGVITGTREELARLGRCSAVELAHATEELKAKNAAEVTERNGNVTLINRRMKREAKAREQTRERVNRHRANGEVTPYARARASDLSLKSESNSEVTGQKLKSDKGGEKALAKLTGRQQELANRFEKCLLKQWVNDAGKWVNRIKIDAHTCERVVAEVESAIKEQRIKTTPAQYAEQIWKEFQ